MNTLVIAEHNNSSLSPVTRNTLTAAKKIGLPITMLVIGYNCDSVINEASKLSGVSLVVTVNHPAYQNFLIEQLVPIILNTIGTSCRFVLAPATTFGKNLLPYVAAKLDVAQISDICKIIDSATFEHTIYAGNAIEIIQSLDAIKILTIRTTSFDPVYETQSACAVESSNLPSDVINQFVAASPTCFIERICSHATRPDLSNARIIVSGGRGLQSAEKFKLIEDLADVMGAAVGASRAAVDAGFVSNDYQIGQTGKIVAPELYIAIGISGAVQHLAGMKDAKIIVAINKDEDAPIMQIANYRLVGDLFVIVPQLIKLLQG
jgi:electron transfer flavoprotein alpha subunit